MEEDEVICPLVSEFSDKLGMAHKTMDLLWRVRQHDPEDGPIPVTIPPSIRKTTKTGKEFKIRNYQTQSIAHMIKMHRYIDGHAVGLGKAQPLTAKVLTPSGWTHMGDLKVGDVVTDPDGGEGVVEAVFPQGTKTIYCLETMDGARTECCEDHLWHVYTMEDKQRKTQGRVLTTAELLKAGVAKANGPQGWRRSKFFLPLVKPVEFNASSPLPIAPYTMGALLGDGGWTTCATHLSTIDPEISDRVAKELPDNLKLAPVGDGVSFRISSGLSQKNENQFAVYLKELKLRGTYSHQKFIPESYLRASVTDRLALLQGLLDTDGSCAKSGLVYYYTSSIKLAQDISELVRSLGGVAKISKPKKAFYVYNGEKRQGKDSFYVSIKTEFNPFFLARKVALWRPQLLARAIKSIEQVSSQEAQCIRVSTTRNLYITDDYIVTHNTISAIVASAYILNKRPDFKVIVLGTKSTTYQWAGEYENFSHLKAEVLQDTYKKMKGSEARLAQIEDFLNGESHVLVAKYTSLVGRRALLDVVDGFDQDGNPAGKNQREAVSPEVQALVDIMKQHGHRVILVLDECQKFKSTTSQIRNMILKLQPHMAIIWAMTATVIQNSLDEFYSIACAIGIRPFGAMRAFRERFCIYRSVHVGRGIYKDQLEGYRDVKAFKLGMRPFYYGRSQSQVKEPIPKLNTVYHPVDLDKVQARLITHDIKNGTFILPPIMKKNCEGEFYEKERDIDNRMTMLAVVQQIANNPCLLDKTDLKALYSKALSPKEEMLLDLLDGELAGEKVLVFTKSRVWIDRFEELFKRGHFSSRKFLRITGAESEKQREVNKQLFQNSPDYDLLFINTAAAEGVNLQQAAHMICLDLPWSWGVLLQLVGRMVRMASPHSACTLHIVPARGTVDEYTIDTLKGKSALFEAILGETYSAGCLTDSNDLDLASGMDKMNDDAEFMKLLKAHVKSVKMGSFIDGKQVAEAQALGEDYKMAHETPASVPKKRVSFSEEDFAKWKFD